MPSLADVAAGGAAEEGRASADEFFELEFVTGLQGVSFHELVIAHRSLLHDLRHLGGGIGDSFLAEDSFQLPGRAAQAGSFEDSGSVQSGVDRRRSTNLFGSSPMSLG